MRNVRECYGKDAIIECGKIQRLCLRSIEHLIDGNAGQAVHKFTRTNNYRRAKLKINPTS
jgi:hypothetical protein